MKRIGALAAMIGFAVQRSRFLFIATVVVSAFLAASSASAADLTVVCPGGGPVGPGVYTSITDALNAITNNQGPNSISVSGTCTENVFIFKQTNLNIHNAPGRVAVITNAANPAQITVHLFGSHLVAFDGLTIQGGNTGVLVNEGTDLVILNSLIAGNVGPGVIAQSGSNLTLESCVVRNNVGAGLEIGASSIGTLSTQAGNLVKVLNNDGFGIQVDPGGYLQFNFGGHVVEGNKWAGISAAGARVEIFAGQSANVIQSNGTGVDFNNGSSGRFFGQNVIANNGSIGVSIAASSVNFIQLTAPDGSPAITVVQGHSLWGVNANRSGEVTFDGAHQVTGNGNPIDGAGIRVERSSLSLQNGATVSNNVGPGIFGDAHAGIVLGPTASVTGNSSGGIRLKHQSLVGVTGPVTIQGNGSVNIVCDGTSLAYGQLVGITGVQCGD